MGALSLGSVGFYCIFSIFVFYQQLHVKNFRGSSQWFALILNLSAFVGMITGIAFLAYYGWQVVWWAPIVIFSIGLLAKVAGVFIERAVGSMTLSLAGFLGWPVSAYLMFNHIPK